MEEKQNELEEIVDVCILLATDKVHLDYAAKKPEELKNHKLFQRERMVRAIYFYRDVVPDEIKKKLDLLPESVVERMVKFYEIPSPLYGEWNGTDLNKYGEQQLKKYRGKQGGCEILDKLDQQIKELESKK